MVFYKMMISTNLYDLKSLAYDLVLVMDVISILKLAINKNGIKIAGERNNFQVC